MATKDEQCHDPQARIHMTHAIERQLAYLIGDSIPTSLDFKPITTRPEWERRSRCLVWAYALVKEATRLGYPNAIDDEPLMRRVEQAELVLEAAEKQYPGLPMTPPIPLDEIPVRLPGSIHVD